jgi:hypothetical protein
MKRGNELAFVAETARSIIQGPVRRKQRPQPRYQSRIAVNAVFQPIPDILAAIPNVFSAVRHILTPVQGVLAPVAHIFSAVAYVLCPIPDDGRTVLRGCSRSLAGLREQYRTTQG